MPVLFNKDGNPVCDEHKYKKGAIEPEGTPRLLHFKKLGEDYIIRLACYKENNVHYFDIPPTNESYQSIFYLFKDKIQLPDNITYENILYCSIIDTYGNFKPHILNMDLIAISFKDNVYTGTYEGKKLEIDMNKKIARYIGYA